MRKYTSAPHPFLLQLPHTAENGVHEVGLTLIGRGALHLPYIIHAFQRAGEQGLGKGRTPMTLLDVRQAEPPDTDAWVPVYEPGGTLTARAPRAPTVPETPSAIRLRLETPLRLQRQESLVTPDSFRFSDLFGPLLRRVSMLTYFHTETPLEIDFAGLMQQARQIELAKVNLAWKDWTRYSSRQKTAMKMGGLVGDIQLELVPGSPLWPYLWLGQWIHAGKGTSMGLGRYAIQTASLPKSEFARG
jgi:hypothetical protein